MPIEPIFNYLDFCIAQLDAVHCPQIRKFFWGMTKTTRDSFKVRLELSTFNIVDSASISVLAVIFKIKLLLNRMFSWPRQKGSEPGIFLVVVYQLRDSYKVTIG